MIKKVLLIVDDQLLAEVASHSVGLLLDDWLGLSISLSWLSGVGLDPRECNVVGAGADVPAAVVDDLRIESKLINVRLWLRSKLVISALIIGRKVAGWLIRLLLRWTWIRQTKISSELAGV